MRTPPTIGAGGREYVHWPATGLPLDATSIEVSIDNGTTWHPATRTGDDITALIASPTAPPVDGDIVATSTGYCTPRIRVTDMPEIIIRPAGMIEIR